MGEHYVIFGIPIPNQLNEEICRCIPCDWQRQFSEEASMPFPPFCMEHCKLVEDGLPLFLRIKLPWYALSPYQPPGMEN